MTTQTPISEHLESEHRWIHQRFEQFRQGLERGQVNAAPFREAASVLHRHIYLEEDILFPEVEARGLEGPTTVMAQEHGEICRYLGGIENLIGTGAAASRIRDTLKALYLLLEEHNFKEEQMLYPSADQMIDPIERDVILQRLKASAPPEGWACRAHRSKG